MLRIPSPRLAQLACLFAVLAPAMADEIPSEPRQLRLVVQGGLTYGGDNLSTIETDDGTDKIKAGNLFQIGAGILAQAGTLPLAAQLTYNYHADGADYENGDTSFHRKPIELVFYYTGAEKWRLGMGLRQAGTAKSKVNIDGYPSETLKLKGDTALIFEAGYALSPNFWISGRFVKETYQAQSYNYGGTTYPVQGEVDGSHAGLFATVAF